MKNKFIILFMFICLLTNQLHAQILSPNVWASAGRYQEASGVSLNYTIGELMIQTSVVGSNLFTFGFNQPENILNAVVDVDGKRLIINAFPNPVVDDLTINLSEALPQSCVVTLLDIHGKKVFVKEMAIGTTQLQISMTYQPFGMYIVELRQASGALLHAFKVVKNR